MFGICIGGKNIIFAPSPAALAAKYMFSLTLASNHDELVSNKRPNATNINSFPLQSYNNNQRKSVLSAFSNI